MSANKTIKALREERAQLYAEIRRLQALAGVQPTIREMARDARAGIKAEPSAPVERDERVEFEKWWHHLTKSGERSPFAAASSAWQARAALERKP